MSKTRANKTRAWATSVLALVILAAPLSAYSEAKYSFGTKDLLITLHDDRCDLKDLVTNLPRRAVWKHRDEVVEGCWGFSEQFGLILLYFADRTATALPAQLFNKVTGA